MSTPDPEGMSMLAKVITAGAAILGPVGGLWLWLDSRFAKNHSVNNQLAPIVSDIGALKLKADGTVPREEFERHRLSFREDIRQLYQNAESDRKTVRDGFDQLSKEIHETHVALLTRLDERGKR